MNTRRKSEYAEAFACGQHCREMIDDSQRYLDDAELFSAMNTVATPVNGTVRASHEMRADNRLFRAWKSAVGATQLHARNCDKPGFLDGFGEDAE